MKGKGSRSFESLSEASSGKGSAACQENFGNEKKKTNIMGTVQQRDNRSFSLITISLYKANMAV